MLGWAMAPVTGAFGLARRARMFHPEGVVARAAMRPIAREGALGMIAARLSGPALVRLSSAWWKRREWIDVLGVAVRLRSSDVVTAIPDENDQDLLFATVRTPWRLAFAPLATSVHDFLANGYFAVSPFDAPPLARVKLRLVGGRAADGHDGRDGRDGHEGDRDRSRRERLERDVFTRRASFVLELRAERGEPRAWTPLARLDLLEIVPVDQSALRFDPFRAGRDVRPRGLVHALRRGTYRASQLGRALTESHPHDGAAPADQVARAS
jgi:hypothetical protein